MNRDDLDAALSKSASIHVDAPSPAALHGIAARMAADLRPVRAIAPARAFFAALIGMFVCIVAIAVVFLGPLAIPLLSGLQIVAILALLTIGTGLLADSLVHQMVPGGRQRVSASSLPIAIAFSLAIAIAILFRFEHEANFWGNAWTCIRAGIPISAIAAVACWLVLRRGAILSPPMTGAAAGLFAGLAGTAVLELHCPNLNASHLIASHLGVALLGTMSGFLFGLAAENGNLKWRP